MVLTSKARGTKFEHRVMAYYKGVGKSNVRRSVFLKDGNGNRSEIDVVFGRLWWTRYVECKNYSKDHAVPLEVRLASPAVTQRCRLRSQRW
jgi:hypothetical protein